MGHHQCFFVEATSLNFKYNLGEDNCMCSMLEAIYHPITLLSILLTSCNTTSLASLYYTSPSDILRNTLTMVKLMSLLQLVLVILFTPSLCCPEDQKQTFLHSKASFLNATAYSALKKPTVQVRIMEFQHRLLPIGSCRIKFFCLKENIQCKDIFGSSLNQRADD